jgi:hypothetical protein
MQTPQRGVAGPLTCTEWLLDSAQCAPGGRVAALRHDQSSFLKRNRLIQPIHLPDWRVTPT